MPRVTPCGSACINHNVTDFCQLHKYTTDVDISAEISTSIIGGCILRATCYANHYFVYHDMQIFETCVSAKMIGYKSCLINNSQNEK